MGTFRIGGGRGVALGSAVISLTLAHSTPLHSTPAQTLKARICLPRPRRPSIPEIVPLVCLSLRQLWMCSYFRSLEFSNFPSAAAAKLGIGSDKPGNSWNKPIPPLLSSLHPAHATKTSEILPRAADADMAVAAPFSFPGDVIFSRSRSRCPCRPTVTVDRSKGELRL